MTRSAGKNQALGDKRKRNKATNLLSANDIGDIIRKKKLFLNVYTFTQNWMKGPTENILV